MRFARGALFGALMLGFMPLLVLPGAAGEKDKAGHDAAPAKPAAASKPAAPVLPDADKIVLLVRTTLITVNDAVQTGNFTVLRDKAAPAFRDGTTPAGLMQTFMALTSQRIDLSPVAVIAPQLTEMPALDKESRLKLKGYFPGQPVGIAFDMTFEAVGGSWRIFGLSVGLAKMPDVPKASAQAPTQPSAANAPSKAAAPR